MSRGLTPDENLVRTLPLPLAQLYRRAHNAKTALDRHHHAFYLAEAALKLAAAARISMALAAGLEPRSPLARSLEQLCLPSIGHWVGFLQKMTDYLKSRPDVALLPLAETHEALLRHEALPAVQAFAERASRDDPDQSPPLAPEQVRDAARQGVLGFFNLVAAYRNQVLGHGAQRPTAFYEEVGPLLLDAAGEVLRQDCLFGGLTLAVARLASGGAGRAVQLEWQGLRGPASLMLPPEAAGPEPDLSESTARAAVGRVYFLAPGIRVPLHPLVVYQEDRSERERVGFLNRTVTRRRGAAGEDAVDEVRRCEYLDYATGDQLKEVNARHEMTQLLARLRGQAANESDVDRVIASSRAEPLEAAPPPLGAGAVIGDFALEGELGRGGMGVVYRARQRSLNRLVALKVLPPALAVDPVALARFRREIVALARCEHPNLIKIFTSGSDEDRHFYAMELVEGTNLADLSEVLASWREGGRHPLREGHLPAAVSSAILMAERRRQALSAEDPLASADSPATLIEVEPIEPTPPPATASGRALPNRLGELFAEVADALAHLHGRGILHRDIKPGNLMLTADGRRLVLMDLGLARLDDEARDRLTCPRQFIGTLRYASLEQAASAGGVDARSDIYSLGATFWELLALRPLYGAVGDLPALELIRHIQFDEPGRIRTYRPEVSEELEAIVLKCLEKDPCRRYATAGELAEDLGRWRRGELVQARRQTLLYRARRHVGRHRLATAVNLGALAAIGTLYVGLADGGLAVPGGDCLRRWIDRHEASFLRPIPSDQEIRCAASRHRARIAQRLVESTTWFDGWVSSNLSPDSEQEMEAWTNMQALYALAATPETSQDDLRRLIGNIDRMLTGPDPEGRIKPQPFVEGFGWELDRREKFTSADGAACGVVAIGRNMSRLGLVPEGERGHWIAQLARIQRALETYRSIDPKTGKVTGGWNMFPRQGRAKDSTDLSDCSSMYTTGAMFMALLDLRKAGLPWRGSEEERDRLLRETWRWLKDPTPPGRVDDQGWYCMGLQESEASDGLTLFLAALMLRAEAEAGLELPDVVARHIPRHLDECAIRLANYPISVCHCGTTFTDHRGTFVAHGGRPIKLMWYPWAIDCAIRWQQRELRNGASHDEIVRTRRVLGHLVIELGRPVIDEVLTGWSFVAADTLLGLSAVELPDGDCPDRKPPMTATSARSTPSKSADALSTSR